MVTLPGSAKALVAALVGLAGVVLTLLKVDPTLSAAIIAVASTVFVFAVPNAPPE